MAEAVGIDLGTMYSCAAFVTNGKVEVIQADDSGKRVVPSCVAFVGEEELVGDGALAKARRDPTKVIYDAKRLIGRSYNEQSVQDDIEKWPFKVVDSEGRPTIQVEHKGQTKSIVAEEVSAMVLRKLIADATKRIGQEVKKAVITVPAYFTDSQKRATKEAARMAGIEVLRLLPEPTAAAVAYGRENKVSNKTVLVYDLGGGTFDVSIVKISGKHYDVRAVGGNSHLGGNDIDYLIVQYVAEEVLRILKYDVGQDIKKMFQLLQMCEEAKRNLSSMTSVDISIGNLVGTHYELTLERQKVEELCKDLLQTTITTVEAVLSSSKLSPGEIDEVVLVGGSTHMPCIKTMLGEMFGKSKISCKVNPDEVVACGAAYYADQLSRNQNTVVLKNMTPLSIGVEVYRGVFEVVIPRNTVIPVTKKTCLSTSTGNQSEVPIRVYQGERLLLKKNKFIGEFMLKNIPAAPAGLRLKAALTIDEDGILSVTVKVGSQKVYQSCAMKLIHLDNDDVLGNLEDAELYKDEDQREKDRLILKFELEQRLVNSNGAGEVYVRTREWLTENPDASIDEIRQKLHAL